MLHNNGWGKSRNQVLNRQKSSVSHNQDKQSSASQMKLCATQQRLEEVPEPCFEQAGNLCATQSGQGKLCATQSGQVKLCVTQQRLGKKPEPGFEQAAKLCATQSGQVKLCVTQQRLGKKPEPGFEQAAKLCAAQSGQGEALCRKRAGERAGTLL